MTIQDLGSIGELIAAIATVATLVYLATQMRRNTRALRSSTVQNLPAIMMKGARGLDGLPPEERLQLQAFLIMGLRRLESVHVRSGLGSITEVHERGSGRSAAEPRIR